MLRPGKRQPALWRVGLWGFYLRFVGRALYLDQHAGIEPRLGGDAGWAGLPVEYFRKSIAKALEVFNGGQMDCHPAYVF